jgi:lipoprotein-anchoring transpeptidase ErfK/SrfK
MMQQRDMRNRSYATSRRANTSRPRRTPWFGLALVLILIAVGVLIALYVLHHMPTPKMVATSITTTTKTAVQTTQQQKTVAQKPSICATNTLTQAVYVSISQRHMWACDSSAQSYDSAVVTGMENIAADLTPTGTYHVYGKQTALYLDGSDSTGSWHDFVNYWMPFLSNQYGVYGFHDATWRQPNDFGNISPYSSSASHGCVELPLATAKWLYNWASVGTTVIIQS